MRHQLTLPKHPSLLFLIIVFDLFALVAVYGLYGTNWVGSAGIPVKLSQLQARALDIDERSLVVKIFPDSSPNCIVNKKAVPLTNLQQELEQAKEAINADQVLLMVDDEASIARERQVLEMVKSLNLDCILIGEINNQSE